MTERLYHLIHLYTAPLYTSLYHSTWFFIDYWSFIHLVSGLLIVCCAGHLRLRHPWRTLGIILVSWEILEIFFIYIAVRIFKPENIPDQITDILIGLLGGYIGFLFLQPERNRVGQPN
jgi:hypothetical protein